MRDNKRFVNSGDLCGNVKNSKRGFPSGPPRRRGLRIVRGGIFMPPLAHSVAPAFPQKCRHFWGPLFASCISLAALSLCFAFEIAASLIPLLRLFREKARLFRLFACKRAHDGSTALPPFRGLDFSRTTYRSRRHFYAASRSLRRSGFSPKMPAFLGPLWRPFGRFCFWFTHLGEKSASKRLQS